MRLWRRLFSSSPERSSTVLPDRTGSLTGSLVAMEKAHPRLADALLGAVTAAVTVPWILRPVAHAGAGTWLLEAGLIVPLVWRRCKPQAVFVVLAAVAAVQWWTAISLTADVSLLIALYTIAAHRARVVAIAGAAVLEVGVIMATTRWILAGSWIRSLVFVSGLVAAAVLLGANLQSRRANLEALIERARRLEFERDQHARIAAAAERTRIAREMHDVIAHSLAVIITMADAAAAKLRREPDRAEEAIHNISDVGREALRETRRLLGVLRDDFADDGLTPQPTIAQLSALVDKLKATGLDAELSVDGEPFAIPPGAELAVYRIAQEAATNALKHAVAATALHLRLRYDVTGVDIMIANDGDIADVASRRHRDEALSGHGIAGMRERVSLYDGSLRAGPHPTGGWVVSAHLAIGAGLRS
jgi:signal transduction histidine kinase